MREKMPTGPVEDGADGVNSTPGFNKEKTRMSPEEKVALSGVELETQERREATIDDAVRIYDQKSREKGPQVGSVGEAQKGVAGEIVNEALRENLQRAQDDENRVAKGMDINNMSAKDREALVAAQKKTEDAFLLKLRGEGKN